MWDSSDSSDMDTGALDTLVLAGEMPQALKHDQFVLHYQPVVNLANGAVTGFEALVRWNHGTRGLLPPGEFIPLAENNGFMEPLGEWVISNACRQMAAWTDAEHSDMRVAVNLSARQFQSAKLVDHVEETLLATGLYPHRLLLEITESMMLPNLDRVRKVLDQFHEMGIAIAMDDFGTGYASLSYLHALPIEYLKIDRSFVNRSPTDRSACTIIQTIINMAQSLDLTVIAEGVETLEQFELLRRLGCHEAQGYYFSRPVPSKEAENLRLPSMDRT